MPHILLTGAGFSRNWGGWVADEAFEYLLGCPQITPEIHSELWEAKRGQLGFEYTLQILRYHHEQAPQDKVKLNSLRVFEHMLEDMFNSMNNGFKNIQFNPSYDPMTIGGSPDSIRQFLTHFDAIFTLNQDALLEIQYDKAFAVRQQSQARWRDFYMPGLEPVMTPGAGPYVPPGLFKPSDKPLQLENHRQPYFKLHGSSNWRNEGSSLLIMGGNKGRDIEKHPLLMEYQDLFRRALTKSDCRVVVIGYGFGDQHINDILLEGVAAGMKMFVIDARGIDALRGMFTPNFNPIQQYNAMTSCVLGASRRELPRTFSTDHVERAKIMRFLTRLGPPTSFLD
jgi:hypothetical protein